MAADQWAAAAFEENRPHLRAVAYRMLGSVSDADDAVQDAWIRVSGSDTREIANQRGWLTTVVARICLNMLRTRRTRGERSLDGTLPEPIVSGPQGPDPQQEALLGEAVGMAMLVVLDTLSPAERVAFVLHDVFGLPFEEIAPIVGRSSAATRQLASRGRRRVRGSARPDVDLDRQRDVVDAFITASRQGDLRALLAVLDPDVVIRVDGGEPSGGRPLVVSGAKAVAAQAMRFRELAPSARPAVVNGTAGAVVFRDGRPYSIIAATVSGGRIVELGIITDAKRIARVDLSVLDGD
jgi:RNA polymerase sigma-70 factor (ECF subfamily)